MHAGACNVVCRLHAMPRRTREHPVLPPLPLLCQSAQPAVNDGYCPASERGPRGQGQHPERVQATTSFQHACLYLVARGSPSRPSYHYSKEVAPRARMGC